MSARQTDPVLTWFDGCEGVVTYGNQRQLHLRVGGGTFCGIPEFRVRPITWREADSPRLEWCDTCRLDAEARAAVLRETEQ